ncbi:MAG: sensor histidine kinase [Desulfobacteraceae bacterium]|nr:MAG: sensor histidine kinase [Desulfobacteraceae bacterium]
MEKQRLKFDFLIHDLKVPLAVIEAGVRSLLEKQDKYGVLSEKQEKILLRALRNAKVTSTLVNDALELGRSSEGIMNKSRCSIASFVEQSLIEIFDLTESHSADLTKVCRDLNELKKNLFQKSIQLEIDESIWKQEVYIDESKIRQIFRNLLNNALKYRKNLIEIKLAKSAAALDISVRDDGQGIPRELHEKIFKCYFQMDMQNDQCVRGHGLGLAGVMILLEDMGGRMTLESDTGKGTVFSVTIPL